MCPPKSGHGHSAGLAEQPHPVSISCYVIWIDQSLKRSVASSASLELWRNTKRLQQLGDLLRDERGLL